MKFSSVLFRRGIILITSFCLLFALSCQKERTVTVSPVEKSNSTDPVLEYIISLGFDKAHIVDQGDFYLADGDIKFDKNLFVNKAADKGARPAHSIFNARPIVNYDNVDKITVRVLDNFGNDDWRNRVTQGTIQAIGNWNNIYNTRVHLSYTTSPTANITVMFRRNLGTYYGVGNFPSNCQAGDSLSLASITSGLSVSKLTYLITHELGHCLGFRHTNEGSNQGSHIPDTPYTEAASVMNSGGATVGNTVPDWSTFSTYDKIATSIIYPPAPYADASNVNSSSGTIHFKWTVSYFCNPYVNIIAFDDFGTIVKSQYNNPNSGLFDFSTTGLSQGSTYEFQVSDPNDPNHMVYTTLSL
jgi:hypothetical protein